MSVLAVDRGYQVQTVVPKKKKFPGFILNNVGLAYPGIKYDFLGFIYMK